MAVTGQAYVWARDRWTVRAGEWCLFALARGFRAATWLVPIWTLTGIAAALGRGLTPLVGKARRRAEANLALVWPDRPGADRRRLVRETGAAFLRLCVEYAHLDRWARSVALDIEGADRLDSASGAGKGIVIVTAHYGNWEAIRLAALRQGVECGIIYRAFNNRYLDRFTVALIGGLGRPVLQKGKTGMRELVGHLRRGGAIMILVDQRNSGAPFLPFLGEPAETVLAAANLARLTGAALIPAVGRRDAARRRFSVRFETPVAPDRPEAMMTAVNARISGWIEAEPAQWFWFHRRWRATGRSRPSG